MHSMLQAPGLNPGSQINPVQGPMTVSLSVLSPCGNRISLKASDTSQCRVAHVRAGSCVTHRPLAHFEGNNDCNWHFQLL